MPENHDCAGNAAAYVLGALDEHEVDEFRRHLASCAVCRDEVIVFGGVVDALPASAAQYPVPKGLRRRVMRAVRNEPRLDTGGRKPARPSWWSTVPRGALAAGVAVAAVVAVVIGVAIGSSSSGGTRVISASVGNAELRVSGARADLIVHHLPPPGPGRIYELWTERAGQPPAPTAALFSVTSAGTAQVGVPGSVSGVSKVLVTPEPDGGSQVPTHAPVIVASTA
jgi:anti-sigma-K factor RskA